MSARQVELLCLIRAGLSPFFGAVGRRIGAVVRNLERLRLRGFLYWRGRSQTYRLSARGRAIIRA